MNEVWDTDMFLPSPAVTTTPGGTVRKSMGKKRKSMIKRSASDENQPPSEAHAAPVKCTEENYGSVLTVRDENRRKSTTFLPKPRMSIGTPGGLQVAITPRTPNTAKADDTALHKKSSRLSLIPKPSSALTQRESTTGLRNLITPRTPIRPSGEELQGVVKILSPQTPASPVRVVPSPAQKRQYRERMEEMIAKKLASARCKEGFISISAESLFVEGLQELHAKGIPSAAPEGDVAVVVTDAKVSSENVKEQAVADSPISNAVQHNDPADSTEQGETVQTSDNQTDEAFDFKGMFTPGMLIHIKGGPRSHGQSPPIELVPESARNKIGKVVENVVLTPIPMSAKKAKASSLAGQVEIDDGMDLSCRLQREADRFREMGDPENASRLAMEAAAVAIAALRINDERTRESLVGLQDIMQVSDTPKKMIRFLSNTETSQEQLCGVSPEKKRPSVDAAGTGDASPRQTIKSLLVAQSSVPCGVPRRNIAPARYVGWQQAAEKLSVDTLPRASSVVNEEPASDVTQRAGEERSFILAFAAKIKLLAIVNIAVLVAIILASSKSTMSQDFPASLFLSVVLARCMPSQVDYFENLAHKEVESPEIISTVISADLIDVAKPEFVAGDIMPIVDANIDASAKEDDSANIVSIQAIPEIMVVTTSDTCAETETNLVTQETEAELSTESMEIPEEAENANVTEEEVSGETLVEADKVEVPDLVTQETEAELSTESREIPEEPEKTIVTEEDMSGETLVEADKVEVPDTVDVEQPMFNERAFRKPVKFEEPVFAKELQEDSQETQAALTIQDTYFEPEQRPFVRSTYFMFEEDFDISEVEAMFSDVVSENRVADDTAPEPQEVDINIHSVHAVTMPAPQSTPEKELAAEPLQQFFVQAVAECSTGADSLDNLAPYEAVTERASPVDLSQIQSTDSEVRFLQVEEPLPWGFRLNMALRSLAYHCFFTFKLHIVISMLATLVLLTPLEIKARGVVFLQQARAEIVSRSENLEVPPKIRAMMETVAETLQARLASMKSALDAHALGVIAAAETNCNDDEIEELYTDDTAGDVEDVQLEDNDLIEEEQQVQVNQNAHNGYVTVSPFGLYKAVEITQVRGTPQLQMRHVRRSARNAATRASLPPSTPLQFDASLLNRSESFRGRSGGSVFQ